MSCDQCGAAIALVPRTFPATQQSKRCSDACRKAGKLAGQRARWRGRRKEARAYSRAWQAAHKDELKVRRDARRAADPAGWRARSRAIQLKNRYGITAEQYAEMLAAQDGRCAMCREPETRVVRGIPLPLAVDHDHATGRVRGLLCNRCNVALGFIEQTELHQAALAYLQHHGRLNSEEAA